MKLKKFLLGSAFFLVVSLCSFTLAYADDFVSGTVQSGLTEVVPFYNSFSGSSDSFIWDRNYDFPITVPTPMWRLSSNSSDKLLDIGFDNPLTSGTFFMELSDSYYKWTTASNVYITFADNTVIDAKSSTVFTPGSSNFLTISFDLSDVYPIMHGGIVHIMFVFSGGTVRSEMVCHQAYVFPNDMFSFLGIGQGGIPASEWSSYWKRYNISYDSALILIDILNHSYTGLSLPRMAVSPTGYYFSIDNYSINSNSYFDYISATTTWSASEPSYRGPLIFRNSFGQYFFFTISSGTNYGKETVLSLQELINLMGGNGGVDEENERAQQAITDVDDALGQQEDLEHAWQGSMTSNFNALAVSSFDFDTDTASGLTLVGSVFSSLWNSMGKWSVLYSFPLLLGVVLLLIGRISRHDKKERREQSKSNKK